MATDRDLEDGFTLVELIVVVTVIAILAAIGIPRFLAQREKAHDTTAVSDLRNLIVVETSLAASSEPSDVPSELAAQGWKGSDDRVRVCADVDTSSGDFMLTAWHLDGTLQYSYRRSRGVLESQDVPLEETCAAQLAPGDAEQVWPYP